MRIDEILAFNERFVEQTHLPTIGHAPRKQMALVTCMDCRLVQMFEQALGLERGDVLELRTAGATISEKSGEAGRTTSFGRWQVAFTWRGWGGLGVWAN